MDERLIRQYVLTSFEGVQVVDDEENSFFFYDAENRAPFVTIVANNKYDTYSDLNRQGVFRLNIGVGKQIFRSMFPVDRIPTETGYVFTALDVIMPHPEYGRVFWVCVLNPSDPTFLKLEPMLTEAFEIAVRKCRAAQAARGKAHKAQE